MRRAAALFPFIGEVTYTKPNNVTIRTVTEQVPYWGFNIYPYAGEEAARGGGGEGVQVLRWPSYARVAA